MAKGSGISKRVDVPVAAAVVVVLFCFLGISPVFAAGFEVRTITGASDITVMEAAGDYAALAADGSHNSAVRAIVAREFYRTHADRYDFLLVFTNFDFAMPREDSVAVYTEVKNDVRGISQPLFDRSEEFGSAGVWFS